MSNHDKYLDPPDEPPYCEDGCGETLVKDFTGVWLCENKFCPLKFQGVEQEMAYKLVETLQDLELAKWRLHNMRYPKL